MSKKKDPYTWRGMNQAYKDAKHTPFEDNETPHIKKKQKKKIKRANHKHVYVPAVYIKNGKTYSGKPFHSILVGNHCEICGRVNDMLFASTNDRLERFKEEYPNYVTIELPEEWDYFKNKYIVV